MSDGDIKLRVGRVRVDPKFGALLRPVRSIALGVHASGRAVLSIGLPCHHKLTNIKGSDKGFLLNALPSRVDQKLGALLCPVRLIPLCIHAIVMAVLVIGRPCDHKLARAKAGDGGAILTVGGVGVHPKFSAVLCPVGSIQLGVDT